MFGFAYGQKENGAVFSHMTTMYGNALYTRGFKKEGFKVIDTLYRHAADFESAGIYPGVPEYFDPKGRGVYHYLTGAASWLMLTVLTEMFGVKGQWGDIVFEPKLLPEQFDGEGKAGVSMEFNGCPIDITYVKTSSGDSVTAVEVDGVVMDGNRVPADKLSTDKTTYIRVTLD
jgi:cellobiose phosphorylase